MQSEPFEILQGLHQGDPLSMTGYSLYSNDLLKLLNEANNGIKLGNTTVPAIAFADDLTIIAKNKYAMQDLLNIVFEYSSTWRLDFNPAK